MIFRILDFYRLSDLGCPDFMGTTGLGCCIPSCFLVMLTTSWDRPWRGVENVNDWCFRDIYKGGL